MQYKWVRRGETVFLMYYYGEGALLYDLVEHGMQGDSGFYLREAKKVKRKVLEMGCGTGRIYLELLKSGVDAYGFDVSGEMLKLLEKKAKEAGLFPKVKKADMTSFRYPFKFDLIIIPYRGFNHILTREGQAKCLQNAHKHLKKGGRLMLDFFDPSVDALSKGKLAEKAEFEDSDGRKIFAEWTWRYELLGQMAHLHCRVKGRNRPAREMDVRIRYIFPGEFMNLLESCGFKKWKLYGGFESEKYERNGQELVWIAEK